MAGDESRIPPEMRHAAFDQRPIPTGWYENPTTWPKRIVLALLALVGFAVALYLSLFQVSALYFPDLQINLLGSVWDPFFDSYEVLDFLHWPDAIPGVLAYGAEVVLNILGDKYRWRTAPWTVIAFGLIIFPAAAVSTVLLIVQPIFVDSWCTLCIVSALVSFVICGLGADEVLATLQHLKRVRDSGGSLKRALWGEGLKGLLSVLSRKREV
jgi:Vitamin K epoxide reductase family